MDSTLKVESISKAQMGSNLEGGIHLKSRIMTWTELEATRIYYEIVGQGPRLVLIPGFGCDHRIFAPLLPIWQQHFQILVFDPRGLGESDAYKGEITLKLLARDLAQLLQKVSWPQANILGVSMGSLVAQQLALDFPKVVEKLILVSSFRHATNYSRRMLALFRNLLLNNPPEVFISHILTLSFAPQFINQNPAVIAFLEQTLIPAPETRDVLEKQLDMLETLTDPLPLENIQCPTLILAGALDIISLLEENQKLQQAIPGAKLVVLKQSAHSGIGEEPEASLSAILSFLQTPGEAEE